MLEEFLAPRPIATLNRVNGAWVTDQTNLLCGHLVPFFQTWPLRGMTRDGVAYAQAMPAHLTNDLEFLSLPTPLVDDAKNNGHNENRFATLASVVYKLPTPTARDSKDGNQPHFRNDNLQLDTLGRAVTNDAWNKYAQAIERWEQVLGRPAPSPTKPDARDGSHRLNSEFSEWMMGLSKGWVTNCGLSRADELKACGNGVVPQQAKLALSILLEGVKW
jgi:hypothetical protein